MIQSDSNRVFGNYFSCDFKSLCIFGDEYFSQTDMQPGLAFMNRVDTALEVRFANHDYVHHVLMPARSLALVYNAVMVYAEPLRKYATEFTEYLSVPGHGVKEFHVLSVPVAFSRATLLVLVIQDELYDLIAIDNPEFRIVSNSHLVR